VSGWLQDELIIEVKNLVDNPNAPPDISIAKMQKNRHNREHDAHSTAWRSRSPGMTPLAQARKKLSTAALAEI
jgi:hypothetical protein